MKHWALIKNGELEIHDQLKRFLLQNEGKKVSIEIPKELRTSQQNSAIHLYLTQVSTALQNEGYTLQDVVKAIRKAEIIPTMEALKEILWKPIQWILYRKKSSTKLEKLEVDKVYECIDHFLAKEFPNIGHIPFPSQEELEKIDPEFIKN